MRIDLSDTGSEALEFLKFRNKEVHGYWVLVGTELHLYNPLPCQHLTVDNLCKKYKNSKRPSFCKSFLCNRYKK